MKRRDRLPEQPRLRFDPPLRSPPPSREAGISKDPVASQEAPAPERSLPLFPEMAEASASLDDDAEGVVEKVEPRDSQETVTLGRRFAAGVADLLVHAAVLLLVVVGQRIMGMVPTWEQAPAFGLFLLAFSFPYTAISLAFWGQTPGMSVAGIEVRTPEGENLILSQTAVRWLVAILTCALAGIPLLLALTGRSFGDRVSGSETRRSGAGVR